MHVFFNFICAGWAAFFATFHYNVFFKVSLLITRREKKNTHTHALMVQDGDGGAGGAGSVKEVGFGLLIIAFV